MASMNIGGGGAVGALLSVVFPVAGVCEGRGDLGSSVDSVGCEGSDMIVEANDTGRGHNV